MLSIEGDVREQYRRVRDYAFLPMNTNFSSWVKISTDIYTRVDEVVTQG